MTDKELIELAAKAAGLLVLGYEESSGYLSVEGERFGFGHQRFCWNPLIDDGDALRLAVKLNLDIWQAAARSGFNSVEAISNDHETTDFMVWATEERGNDPYAATRRAIVRAAAAVGEML